MKFVQFSFFALLLSLTTFLFAENSFDPNHYRYFVEESHSYVNDNDQLITSVTLSNQTEWHHKAEHGSWLQEKGAIPFIAVGTEVFISPGTAMDNRQFPDRNNLYYWLDYSGSNGRSYAMSVILSAYQENLPTLRSKKSILIQEAGWFFPAEFMDIWTLSDGSKWAIKSYNIRSYAQFEKLQIGDRVLVSAKDGSYKNWIMSNTDRIQLVQGSVIFTGMYQGYDVEPYFDSQQ